MRVYICMYMHMYVYVYIYIYNMLCVCPVASVLEGYLFQSNIYIYYSNYYIDCIGDKCICICKWI